MPESIEVTQALLGLKPYILIEADTDDTDELTFKLRAGGGITSTDDITATLLGLVEQLTGVEADLYVTQINTMRHAAGMEPLLVGA